MITENSLTEAQSIFYNNTKKYVSMPGYIPLKLSDEVITSQGWNTIIIKCVSYGSGVFLNSKLVEQPPVKSVCLKYRVFSFVIFFDHPINEVRISKTGISEHVVNNFTNCCYVPFRD